MTAAPTLDRDRRVLLRTTPIGGICGRSSEARIVHFGAPMVRLGSVLVAALALAGVACGGSASLEFAKGEPAPADAGAVQPYPDAAAPTSESGGEDAAGVDGPPVPKCAPGKDGKGNVCVRVLRGSVGPSINEESNALGLDGRGAVLVGLSAVKPNGEPSFVTKTWFPSESSGTGKLAASELPKIAEPLSVAPGTYYVYAIFRDQEPYVRPGFAIGDYVPRLSDVPTVVVDENGGVSVDVVLHPLRAVDVDVKLGADPVGSGAGPVRAWLLSGTSIVGEGVLPCVELSDERTARVRVLTTETGALSLAAAFFDLALPGDGTPLELPSLPAGSMHEDEAARPAVTIASGEWIAPDPVQVVLDQVVPVDAPKPSDPTPGCTTALMPAK